MEHPHNFLSDQILYQVFLRTFSPEGTLRHAEKLLDHIASLGVTTVYLAPVTEADDGGDRTYWSDRQKASGSGNPKNSYRMKDYFHVDPEYGTDEELHAFIARAHELGLNVMMDLVYLHCGPNAPMLYKHPEFCEWGADGKPVNAQWHFPKLNFASAALREYLWGNMEYWVREFDVDGFRCDVGDAIPLDFWAEGIRRVRAIKPTIAMLDEGVKENFLSDFDAQYHWQWNPQQTRQIARGELNAADLRAKLLEECVCPAWGRTIRCSDTHDTASDDGELRLETQAVCPQAADALMVLNFLLPGVPFLYNGQEFADANNCNMFCNRFFMPGRVIDWSMLGTARGQQRMKLVQQLCALKRTHSALNGGSCALPEEADPALLTLTRENGTDRLTLQMNLSAQPIAVKPTDAAPILQSGASASQLEPYGWQIFAC